MKPEENAELIRYRLEQATTSLENAEFLLTENLSPQSIVNRSYDAIPNNTFLPIKL